MPGTDEAGAAIVNGGGSLAACATALSDDVLEVLDRNVEGGDPYQMNKQLSKSINQF